MNSFLAVINNVTKTFPGMDKPALDSVSSSILPGKITGLVGPDGAGKTTLLRLMVGLLGIDSGFIQIAGFDAAKEAEHIHALCGYMPQKFGLYEDLTVKENLSLYAELRGVAKNARNVKFTSLLRFTDLGRFQERLAGDLSGGMKQKLGLACALIGDPQFLLLDEPSVGVDPISRRELWKMVQNLLTKNIGVMWATSYLDEAEKCDTVILLNEGKKLHDGPPSDLLSKVQGRTWHIKGIVSSQKRSALATCLRDPNVIDGTVQGKYLRILTTTASIPVPLQKYTWNATPPRFEDAFIDILGGGPKGDSLLASQLAPKKGDAAPVIDALALTKKFGNFTAVSNNTFQIHRGEIFGLLGPNGAGKSTTFKMMCGLLQPTSGHAYITGLDLKIASSKARGRIGYMAQKFSLYGNLNVRQNLHFFAGLYGLSRKAQHFQCSLMLDIFDLHAHARMNASDLPLGFKQRLSLACAVMHNPDVLFLDEPTSGVDPITRREFWSHINGMVDKGVTIMVTTHFMDEAEYCDRIALIYRGKNIATGTPDDLKHMVTSAAYPDPTLEDAFIHLIEKNTPATSSKEQTR